MMMRIPNVTPKQVVSEYEKVAAVASGKEQTFMAEMKVKSDEHVRTATEIAKAISPILVQRAQQMTADRQAQTDDAIEIAAKALAKGDLTSIRDIASLRSDQRIKLFARIKELNPNFNMAEVKRKIDMEQSFAVGKDSIGVQSFDTFLQHAGEVTETLKQIQLTDNRLFNKSLNWWRRNMKGTPELARLETSIEPVAKEFESFLLNQRALYADDRRKMDVLLNPDQPLKVTMATLEQMGKTAKDRYSAMNQRYKRTMGHDLGDSFSPDAATGAAKIGIDVSAPSKGGGKYPWEK
jgi:hypothetical protein